MVIIELDKSLAEYDIEYDSTDRTNENVTAVLTIHNTLNKTYTVTSENSNVIVNKINNEEYELTIKDSVNTVVKIEDNLGNATLAEVYVDWIDKKALLQNLKAAILLKQGKGQMERSNSRSKIQCHILLNLH